MFWTIAGFILLVAFASVVTGGVAVFRHFIGAVAARVKLETVRTKISLRQAEFELAKRRLSASSAASPTNVR